MSAGNQKTEKPTPRRLDKARREGRFAASRELTGAVQFAVFITICLSLAPAAFLGLSRLMRSLLAFAFRADLGPSTAASLSMAVFQSAFEPVLLCASATAVASLLVQLAVTGFGFAPQRALPDLTRWNPLQRARELPRQNLVSGVQAMLLGPLLFYAAYRMVRSNLDAYLALPLASPRQALLVIGSSWKGFLIKAALTVVFIGLLDLVRQRRRFLSDLRMSKQDIRDEARESEGNPQVKAKIRRLQRDLARRSMMKEVPLATAVIVNPTHYAVALRYETDSMAAPRVVAKGKNYLALRIRQIATDHEVPIVENPPLAQALYKSVDIGQEIPAHLYRAVAEILAYIFRLMHRPAQTAPPRR